jgi:hypothetical protein
MIVVSPLGYGKLSGPGRRPRSQNLIGYSKILLEEVMPMVDKTYNVSKNREQRHRRTVDGRRGNACVGLNHLDKFAWISAFSSAPMLFRQRQDCASRRTGRRRSRRSSADGFSGVRKDVPGTRRRANAQIRMLWIVCGGRRPDWRQPSIQGLAEIKRRAVHRAGKCPTWRTSGRCGVRT